MRPVRVRITNPSFGRQDLCPAVPQNGARPLTIVDLRDDPETQNENKSPATGQVATDRSEVQASRRRVYRCGHRAKEVRGIAPRAKKGQAARNQGRLWAIR